jgi:hypothetical protein
MRILAIAAFLIIALPAELLAQEPKKDAPFQLLRFGDLEKLNGSWEMKSISQAAGKGRSICSSE